MTTRTPVRSSLYLAAAVCAASVALGAPSDAQGCDPNDGTPPSLTVHPNLGGSGPRLVFDGGAALANGTAFLLLEDPQGKPLPRGLCMTGLRGSLQAPLGVDPLGGAEWELPRRRWNHPPAMRVVAWAPGGGWVTASLSNRIQLPPQVPDGTELWGSGQIIVTEFLKDPTTVGDAAGEWIELYNPTPVPIDVEGWVLSDYGSDSTVLDNGGMGAIVPPGGRFVLGKVKDPFFNGGVTVDLVVSGFTLSNGADEIVISKPNGVIVDELSYDDGVDWPDDAGNSISLDPDLTDPLANDDGASWCHGTTPISPSNPDTGTPGALNDDC